MAIADIVARIAADAKAEAAAIVSDATAEAARVTAEAKATADRDVARTLARERERAETEAATVLANARLRARDEALSARLGVAREALARAEAALLVLPDAEYAAVIARGIAAASTGRETVVVAATDAKKLHATLPKGMKAAGVSLTIGKGTADTERGVVLTGGGVRVEVSPAALVAARRDELLAAADALLFPKEARD